MKKFWWMSGPLMEEADEGNGGGGGGDKEPKDDKKGSKTKEDEPDPDTSSALALYRALQDPDTGKEIIETLARRAGLLDEKPKGSDKKGDEPKVSFSAAKLKAKLGKDYEKFADAIGPAFDEILEERLAELRAEYTGSTTQERWNSSVEKFMESHTLTEEIEDKMRELMEEAPPNVKGKNFDPQRYLNRMYKNALEDLEIEEPEPPRRKSSKSKSRRGNDDELPDIEEVAAPKNATIDDAVEAALKGIRFKRK